MNLAASVRSRLGTRAVKLSLEARVTAAVGTVWEEMLDSGYEEFEHESSLRELLALSRGEDCHYDRPSIGAHYAAWYQARRIQSSVVALIGPLCERTGEMTIVDLGGGTGAAWFALAAIEEARIALGGSPRRIVVHSVDSSVPMTGAARTMWATARSGWAAAEHVEVHARVGGWADPIDVASDALVVGAFLLDHSDDRRARQVAELLARQLRHIRAERCIIISASNKMGLSKEIVEPLVGSGDWRPSERPDSTPLWTGPLDEVAQFRRHLARDLDASIGWMLNSPPQWSEGSGRVGVMDLKRGAVGELFAPAGSQVLLDRDQAEAAEPDGRLTEILGAAGSGKSRVLIERLIRELERSVSNRQPLAIMVTAFNKDLIGQLLKWFRDSHTGSATLGSTELAVKGGDGDVVAEGSISGVRMWTVRFINWDKVPTRLFGLKGGSLTAESVEAVQRIIDDWVTTEESGTRAAWLKANPYVDARFVIQELRRVVFGLEVQSEAEYQTVRRVGRGVPRLPTNSEARRMLWSLLMSDRRVTLFVDRRLELIRSIRRGASSKVVFDRVFIDEGQDFLDVEYSLVIPSLVRDPSGIVVAADPAQAMHTGASYNPPRMIFDRTGSVSRRWKTHRLEGSYRLPIWVAEAVRPLASTVLSLQVTTRSSDEDDAEVDPLTLTTPTSVKNALLGARPILVAADTYDQAAQALDEIISLHRELLPSTQPTRVTWAEADARSSLQLAESIARCGASRRVSLESNTMLRIKGLERPVVLWRSSDIGDSAPAASAPELVYTALTRTTSLLVIALSARTRPDVRKLVTQLDRRHLCFWTEAAERRFHDWCDG